MKCFNCSAPIDDSARFCPRCGANQGFSDELIARGIAGDQSALTELYNKTYDNVYYTVKALIRDEDTALDIMQDSYLKAFRNLSTLKEADKFRAWIKRIAHNNAVDYLRRTKPVMFSAMPTDEDGAEIEFEDTDASNLPEVVIDRQETARLMAEILDTLPEEQRLVISMYYYEGMSVREIAQELGVTENTVKSRLNYARKKIEVQVRDLEKKGTKLYGLAPIPFLLLLLRSWASYSANPSTAFLSGVLADLFGGSSVLAQAANPATGQSVLSAHTTSAAAQNTYHSTLPAQGANQSASTMGYNANQSASTMGYNANQSASTMGYNANRSASTMGYNANQTASNFGGNVNGSTSAFPQQPYQPNGSPQPYNPQVGQVPPQPSPQAPQVHPQNTIASSGSSVPNTVTNAAKATAKAAKKGVGVKILAVILTLTILGGAAVGVMYGFRLGPFADGSSSQSETEYEGTLYTDPTGTWCVNLPEDWDESVKITTTDPNELGGVDVYFEFDALDGERHILLCIYTVKAEYGKYIGYLGDMLGTKLESSDTYSVYTYDYRNTTFIKKESFADSKVQARYDQLAGEVDKVLETYRLK